MPLIGEADRQVLIQRFQESLQGEVTLKLFTQTAARGLLTVPGGEECPYCQQTEELAKELVELSPKLKLEVYDYHGQGAEEARRLSVQRIPALVLGDGSTGGRVKYYGIPMGYEFATILEGIEALSGYSEGRPPLEPALVRATQELVQEPVHLQVFVTPT